VVGNQNVIYKLHLNGNYKEPEEIEKYRWAYYWKILDKYKDIGITDEKYRHLINYNIAKKFNWIYKKIENK